MLIVLYYAERPNSLIRKTTATNRVAHERPRNKVSEAGCFLRQTISHFRVQDNEAKSVFRENSALNMTLSECQKGRVVKTTYQHFPLNGHPCQNARWVVLTPCENSPFVSECIIALYRNGTLSALDGYIVKLEIAAYAQHWHCDPEWCTLDTDIRS